MSIKEKLKQAGKTTARLAVKNWIILAAVVSTAVGGIASRYMQSDQEDHKTKPQVTMVSETTKETLDQENHKAESQATIMPEATKEASDKKADTDTRHHYTGGHFVIVSERSGRSSQPVRMRGSGTFKGTSSPGAGKNRRKSGRERFEEAAAHIFGGGR